MSTIPIFLPVDEVGQAAEVAAHFVVVASVDAAVEQVGVVVDIAGVIVADEVDTIRTTDKCVIGKFVGT